MKKFFSVLVDFIMLILLSIMAFETINCTSGRLFPQIVLFVDSFPKTIENFLIVFGIVTLLYGLLCFWNRISFGKLLVENCNIYVRIFCSNITDLAIVLCLAYIVEQALKQFIYVDFYNLFLLLLGLYTITTIFVKGKSIGNIAFNIIFNEVTYFCIAKRMLCKYSILILFPYVLCRIVGIVEPVAIVWNILFFAFISTIISLIIYREMPWSKWSGIRKIYQVQGNKSYVLILLIFLIASLYISDNSKRLNNCCFLGLKIPIEFKEYPDNHNVKPYYDCMKSQVKSPKEYILGLFEKYDVVVLEESCHGECTEWDLVTDIVTDTTFIEKVGNVFSEYGSAIHQDKIDTFLCTKYASTEDLEKATACLMNYMSGGFYKYIKSINRRNDSLPLNKKIRHHYCDNIDWDYFTSQRRDTIGEDRDKFMAQIVIDWYNTQIKKGTRHKCLVVTNTRHSFGYAGGVEKIRGGRSFLHQTEGNQGMYLFEAIPNKVANVIQNMPRPQNFHFMMFLCRPINYGIWDKAFKKNGYKPVGFDLGNTPFGNDVFDAYCLRGAKSDFCYSDIYTGVIFNKPLSEMREYYHPYHRYAIEYEARQKGITDLTKSVCYYSEIDDTSSYENNMNWAIRWICMSNIIPIYLILISLFFSVISCYLFWMFDLKH